MSSPLLVWFFLSISLNLAVANVVLISNNVSVSFPSMDANFVPAIKGSGERGILYVAEPLHACTQLQNEVVKGSDSPFVLIVRGECSFDEKVRSAQKAGFKAAIVYNNEDSGSLVAMSGTPGGIHIHAVFVSKVSGETLTKYAGSTDTELWIMPTIQNSAWTIMAISVISILTVSSVIATCFFVRRHQIRRDRAHNRQEFHGMSRRRVKALPSLVFTAVLEDNCTSSTCAICLEDYNVGEKLRILPCRHKFHALCVDSWLTAWRTFCPVCKQDARITSGNSPPSEYTPLLTSANSTPFSSFHSSIPTSSAIHILPTPPRSRPHFLSRSSYMNSPAVSISRNSSYRRIQDSSPANSRFMSSYVPSTSNGSPSYLVGSSSHRHASLRHCGESGTSLSGMDSMYSLPEC